MFKPSYLSDAGSYGAYGVDYGDDAIYGPPLPADVPPSGTPEQTKFQQGLTKTQATVTQTSETVGQVKSVVDDIKGLGKALGIGGGKKKTASPAPSAPKDTALEKIKAALTPEEYARFLSLTATTCGPRPSPLKAKDFMNWMICRQQQADSIIRMRTAQTTTLTSTQQTGSGGSGETDQKTSGEEKDNTMLYVGGAVAVLALAVGGYFLFKKK